MRYLFLFIILVTVICTFGQSTPRDTTVTNPNYDKTLAEKLGGDDCGMKSYFLVILSTGTNTTTDKGLISDSYRLHMDNINKLIEWK